MRQFTRVLSPSLAVGSEGVFASSRLLAGELRGPTQAEALQDWKPNEPNKSCEKDP